MRRLDQFDPADVLDPGLLFFCLGCHRLYIALQIFVRTNNFLSCLRKNARYAALNNPKKGNFHA
jgi:hypothetical protein